MRIRNSFVPSFSMPVESHLYEHADTSESLTKEKGPSAPWAWCSKLGSRLGLQVVDILLCLLVRLFGFDTDIRRWLQVGNGLPQAHRLGVQGFVSRACWARSALGHRLAQHGGFHAGERYVQVVAYVGGGHTLSEVLEWSTDLLCRRVLHPRESLDLLRELAVWRQAGRLVLGCAERAAVTHGVIARAHAARVPVLRKS